MEKQSEELVKRIRAAVTPWSSEISEKRMFGGYCTLFKGKMCVGETKGRLMVGVISEKMGEALKHPNVKSMKEFIFISEEGYDTEEKLQQWVELGIEHAKLKSQ